jgi:UDP-glucose 4-epimerase
MKVLVTGGAGYIGGVVADELLQAGHEVIVFDNLSRGHRQAVPKNAELVIGELADRAALDQLLRTQAIDAVMHFAALIEAGESMKAPETFFRNNTANALTLLEAMLGAGVKRFVFSSTEALYGNPERTPIEENDALRPTNAMASRSCWWSACWRGSIRFTVCAMPACAISMLREPRVPIGGKHTSRRRISFRGFSKSLSDAPNM